MPERTAAELLAAAEGHGMRFSYCLREGASSVVPLIDRHGNPPTPEAEATFREVNRRWPEVEDAVARRFVAARFPPPGGPT